MMVLDPALNQALRSNDNGQIQRGCELLGDGPEPCDDSQRKCRDCFWAALFLAIAGLVLSFAVQSKAGDRFDQHRYLSPLMSVAAVSLATAVVFLQLSKKYTTTVVYAALLLTPVILVLVGVMLIVGGWIVVGLLLVIFGFCAAQLFLCCWRSLIPFTVILIQAISNVIEQHCSIVFVALFGCCLSCCWWLLCANAVVGVYLLHHTRIQGLSQEMPGDDKAMLFLVSLVIIWGSMVSMNTCQVASCGVFGRWYFGKDKEPGAKPVQQSLWVACTTSFGSVCLGSFIVAAIRALEHIMRYIKNLAQEDGNIAMLIVSAVMECVIACIGDIIEWFNTYAYVQCAVRGFGFIDAVRATYALCKFANIDLISSNCLVGQVAGLGGVLSGLVGGGFALLLGQQYLFFVFGFFLGTLIGISALQPLTSGVTTLSVCWAENPGALRNLQPRLHQSLCITGAGWQVGEERATAEPASGAAARDLRQASPTVELQPAVTVASTPAVAPVAGSA